MPPPFHGTQLKPRSRPIRWLPYAVAVSLLTLGCDTLQRRLVYFPSVYTPQWADHLGKSQNLERWLSADGRSVGWKRLSPRQPVAGQVLILYGNGGTACEFGHYADVIQQAAAFNVFILEFPGYADRPGPPTERTIEAAADEGFLLLATNGPPVYLVGESLGTGVAAYLAGRHSPRVSGIVLLAPYNRLVDVAQWRVPFVNMAAVMPDQYPAEDYLRTYDGPVAVVVAGHDRALPERFGRRLYDGYAGPKKIWAFPDGNHVTTQTQPAAFWKEIEGFWNQENERRAATTPGESRDARRSKGRVGLASEMERGKTKLAQRPATD